MTPSTVGTDRKSPRNRAARRLPRWVLLAAGLLIIAAGAATLVLVSGADPEDRAPQPDHTAQFVSLPPLQGAWYTIEDDTVMTGERRFRGRQVLRSSVAPNEGRSEVSGSGMDPSFRRFGEGRHHFFGFSVMWPSSFPQRQRGFSVNMQIHSDRRDARGAAAAIGLSSREQPTGADHDDVVIRMTAPDTDVTWQTPMVREVWHDFVLEVKFSTSSSVGFWSLWYRPDGTSYQKVIERSPLAALESATDYGYWKLGEYRSVVNPEPVHVYHAMALIGDTFASVQR